MSLLRFFNRQRRRSFDKKLLRQIGRCLLEELLECGEYELAVHFVTVREMTRLNETFLHHEGSTDVITFPLHGSVTPRRGERVGARGFADEIASSDRSENPDAPALRGEIFISLDEAVLNARRFRVSWQSEVVRYIVHGALHLQGYDDQSPSARRQMKCRENQLLKTLSRRFDFGRLERPC